MLLFLVIAVSVSVGSDVVVDISVSTNADMTGTVIIFL